MSGKDYRDLIAWNKAFGLALAIYKETAYFPTEEKFGLTSQLRRAGVSIPSNIAEGQGRRNGEFLPPPAHRPWDLLKEVETQLLISDALGYFRTKQTSQISLSLAGEVSRLINGLASHFAITNHGPLTTAY